MKALKWIWIYTWAYFFVGLEQLDRLWDWLGNQIDHNDFLCGALLVTSAIILSWMMGIIQIVWM